VPPPLDAPPAVAPPDVGAGAGVVQAVICCMHDQPLGQTSLVVHSIWRGSHCLTVVGWQGGHCCPAWQAMSGHAEMVDSTQSNARGQSALVVQVFC
jgi:hypothetical protein